MVIVKITPFRLLYFLSDAFFPLVWYIVPYRKEVVLINLRHSFPDSTEAEHNAIARKFYKHFLDMVLETLKAYTIAEDQLRDRVKIVNPEAIESVLEEHGSTVLLLPHYNNWEYLGQRLSLQPLFIFRPVYKPLNNTHFDRVMLRIRSKFGAEPMKVGTVFRQMLKDRSRTVMTAFVADQKPIGDRVLWLDFLNQRTAAFRGAFEVARRLNQPLIYAHLKKPTRGNYAIEFELLTDSPGDYTDLELANMFFNKLESEINNRPEFWLWTHRRWKRGKRHIYNTDIIPGKSLETRSEQ